MIDLDLDLVDGTAVVTLGDDANMFDAEFVGSLEAAFGEATAAGANAVVTIGAGKHYSNGFDLDFLRALAPDSARAFLEQTRRLLAQVLVLPLPTVAALNGHAFGVGAILTLAHDARVMRTDRGWFCLPEVDLGMRFDPFLLSLITSKLPRATVEHAILTGHRFGAQDALESGIVSDVAPATQLRGTAISVAAGRAGKQPESLGALKRDLHAVTLALVAD